MILKNIYASILLTSILLIVNDGYSQSTVCRGDTISFQRGEYRGTAKWQASYNGTSWKDLNVDSDTLQLIPDKTTYLRSSIYEGTCQTLFTPSYTITFYDLPEISFDNPGNLCEDSDDLALDFAHPIGGSYSGTGIENGFFKPSIAGIGAHTITYTYTDTITQCTNHASIDLEVHSAGDAAEAGEDQLNIEGLNTYLDANPPSGGEGSWSIFEGRGGEIEDISNPKSLFTANSDKYTLVWTVETACKITTDTLRLDFINLSKYPCPDAPTMTDDDGNVYPTVQINEQCWMAKNLNVGSMIVSDAKDRAYTYTSDNDQTEKYCFDNDEENCEKYGGLYTWEEMMSYTTEPGAQGICPDGWHIPSEDDFIELNDFYSHGDAGTHLKIDGDSGFEGQLFGNRHSAGAFYGFNSSAFFWSSSETVDHQGIFTQLCACNGLLDKGYFNLNAGLSVRCIKDN